MADPVGRWVTPVFPPAERRSDSEVTKLERYRMIASGSDFDLRFDLTPFLFIDIVASRN